ncbi:MAG: DUF1036 domain-containing protein [Hyphomicrobiaceae bacterium]|nr:DUF1036 domain-containing protein [Hyphomicrobiaceae bacterium]
MIILNYKNLFNLALLVTVYSTVMCLPTTVLAGLKFCNATSSRVGIAIGYQDKHGMTTEGWWNINAQTCENLLRNLAPNRYFYIYAVDYERGGEWSGRLKMCVADKEFIIRNVKNCEEHGYNTVKFHEIDVGSALDWTIRLADAPTAKKSSN